MTTVLLVVHLLIAIALVITVLLQPSEGGGLGLGGGGGGGGGGLSGFLSGRGTANALTRTTAVLAAVFMATSIALTIFAGGGQEGSILDELPAQGAPEGAGTGETTGSGTGASGDATQPQPDGGGSGSGESPEVPLE
jgi:preprotein translocase subunit SecG